MSKSPYKKVKQLNNEWVPFVSLRVLAPNKLYKILGIVDSDHKDFGKGKRAHLEGNDGKQVRSQLPGKYLRDMSEDDINTFKCDAAKGNNPYLIFREVMADNSFRIDVVPKCPENDAAYANGEEVPELEDSLDEIKLNESGDKTADGSSNNANDDKALEKEEAADHPNESSVVKSAHKDCTVEIISQDQAVGGKRSFIKEEKDDADNPKKVFKPNSAGPTQE